MTGVQRIAEAFADRPGSAALMPYMMGGFPDSGGARRIAQSYVAGGADLVELGVPFSDPLADGPVIHAAATRALRAGATLAGVLELCRELAQSVPVVLMCYANVLLARGPEESARMLREAGASGLIVPDLPLGEADAMLAACDAEGLALVPLVAPTTPPPRMAAIGAAARGFLYTVGVTGTTGERASGEGHADLLARARACTPVPVALGFGIGTPEQAAEAARAGADGVIVGSRLVRAAAGGEDLEEVVRSFAEALGARLVG